MNTTADTLARVCRALDHAANCSTDEAVRLVMRAHHTMGCLLLIALEDPDQLPIVADHWEQLCRSSLREAAELGLVDMGPHYQAEQRRGKHGPRPADRHE